MSFARPVTAARLVSSADMAEMGDCLTLARRQAREIIADAERHARSIAATASENEAALTAELQARGREELIRFIDEEALANKADGFVRVAREADRIRQQFEALSPWLTDLVERSVRRIIGTLDETGIFARIVAEGIAELDDQNGLMIRVRSDDRHGLRAAMKAYPDHFAGVAGLCTDNTLAPGALVLEGTGGLIDVGIESQITALKMHLEASLKSDIPQS